VQITRSESLNPPDPSRSQPVDLYDELQHVLVMLRSQRAALDAELAERARTGFVKFSTEHAENAAMLGRAYAQVVKEARSLEKDAHRRAVRLSPDEKRRVFVEWFETQLPEHQRAFLQELTRIHNARRAPGAVA
jgi:hypothetical protein